MSLYVPTLAGPELLDATRGAPLVPSSGRELPAVLMRRHPLAKFARVDLLQALADGETREEFGARVGVSGDVIATHLSRLRRHFKVRTSTQLVVHVLRNGWVD